MRIEEEKKYIYDMMREITEERRKLTEVYYDLKKRLDELNELEIRGLEKLSVKGYVDLHNERIKELAVTNVTREANNVIKRIENEHKKTQEESMQKKSSTIPKEEILRLKEIDSKGKVKTTTPTPTHDNTPERKSIKRLNMNELIPVIEDLLKEKGIPMSISEIHQKAEEKLERRIDPKNFQKNALPRALKFSDHIDRATKGYYQYVREKNRK